MIESGKICLNDDVLMEVLSKLPPESVLRFKSVSPEWSDLISSPAFLRRYTGSCRLVAFFQKSAVHETSETLTSKHCNILPLCDKCPDLIKVPRHVGRFVDSSQGLVLCSRKHGSVITYHVGNPLTGRFLELPVPPHGKCCIILNCRQLDKYGRRYSHGSYTQFPLLSAVLICEGNNNDESPTYSVVRAGKHNYTPGDQAKILYTDSYSSKTGEWSALNIMVAPETFHMARRRPPVVANGVVHWYTRRGDILVYNPKGDDRCLRLIKVPYSCKSDYEYHCYKHCHAVTRSVEDDVLWLGILHRHNLMFYMLREHEGNKGSLVDVEEWVLVHEASIFSISRLMKKGLVACKGTTLECLILESRSEVVAVLRQEEKVFLYNVHRKSLVKVDYSGRYNTKQRLRPYLRSSFLSPYRL